jgi:hypothetical protein
MDYVCDPVNEPIWPVVVRQKCRSPGRFRIAYYRIKYASSASPSIQRPDPFCQATFPDIFSHGYELHSAEVAHLFVLWIRPGSRLDWSPHRTPAESLGPYQYLGIVKDGTTDIRNAIW